MTIKDFAEHLGLSTATVSRAFTPGARINAATRVRILTEAEAQGYSPDTNARRLAQRRSGLIGLDCPGNADILDDLFLVELARGVQAAVGSSGYGLLLNTLPRPGGDIELLREWVHGRAVDGVVLVIPPTFPMEALCSLAGRDVPCVVIAQDAGAPDVMPTVTLDLAEGSRAALRHLRLLGHERIGFLSSIPEDAVHTVYVDFMRSEALYDPACIVETLPTIAAGRAAMHRLLAAPRRPTAVFARTDVLALGALRAARDMGMKVPEDISLIGHDDIVLAGLADPALTTVRVDTAQVGRLATQLLLSALQPDRGARRERAPYVPSAAVRVSTELVVRGSTAPIVRAVAPHRAGESVLPISSPSLP